jgi:uncharacterized protein (UPF0276 family)
MALKLNIRPELEDEIEKLLPQARVRSKTEYINEAIRAFNKNLKRQMELDRLRSYFKSYEKEGKSVLREFAKLKTHAD